MEVEVVHVKRRISLFLTGIAAIIAASALSSSGAAEAIIPNGGYQFSVGQVDLHITYGNNAIARVRQPSFTQVLSPNGSTTAHASFSMCSKAPPNTGVWHSYVMIANVDARLVWDPNTSVDWVDVSSSVSLFGFTGSACDDNSETSIHSADGSTLRLSYAPNGWQFRSANTLGFPAGVSYGIEFNEAIWGEAWNANATSDVPIPDKGPVLPGLALSPLVVTGAVQSAPLQIEVDVQIIHRCRGDLELSLIIPTGYIVPIADPVGCVPNLSETYLVTIPFHTPLNGTWQLMVEDTIPVDTGIIDRWGLRSR